MYFTSYLLFFFFGINYLCGISDHLISEEPVASYIDKYKEIAISEMQRTGIPASIKLAQGILESNSGRSTLAIKANNHFGIKCGNYWQGGTFHREDDDYRNGQLIKSCFRKYDDASQSFVAHSDFLLHSGSRYRYGFLFDFDPLDYQSWAKGLKKSGYATDLAYAEKLISIIEKYELFQYDNEGLNPEYAEEIIANNDSQVPNIEEKERNEEIRKKRSRIGYFQVKDSEHNVKKGETMQWIADQYNIDIDLFYFQNRLANGSQPRAGQKLKLKGYFHWGKKPKIYKSRSSGALQEEFLFEKEELRIAIR